MYALANAIMRRKQISALGNTHKAWSLNRCAENFALSEMFSVYKTS